MWVQLSIDGGAVNDFFRHLRALAEVRFGTHIARLQISVLTAGSPLVGSQNKYQNIFIKKKINKLELIFWIKIYKKIKNWIFQNKIFGIIFRILSRKVLRAPHKRTMLNLCFVSGSYLFICYEAYTTLGIFSQYYYSRGDCENNYRS